MKIAIIGPAPPFRGGISLFALNLAKALQDLGHQTVFINFLSQYPALLFPGKDQYDDSLDVSNFSNLRIIVPWNPLSWTTAIHTIKKEEIDMAIVSWFLPFFAPAYGYIMRRIPQVRKIILAHNIRPHERWPFAKSLQNYAFRPADRIMVLSRATQKEIFEKSTAEMKQKVMAGFHPLEECLEELPDSKHRTELLFFGLIKPYKGLDILLKAMPAILKEVPEAKLHIAGEVYGDVTIYTNLISELGIGNSVIADFFYIKTQEIEPLFAKATLCILPYRSASQSGVIATAYQFGVPVLATTAGGLGEYIDEGKTGYLVAPDDPQALSEAIIKHLKAKPDMKSEIEHFISKFNWQKLAKLFVSI